MKWTAIRATVKYRSKDANQKDKKEENRHM